MIDIQGQDWTTYDIPEEFHVRSPENWNGWLILQNPVWGEDGQPTGIIEAVTKGEDGEDVVNTFSVHLLPKELQQEADIHIGVHDSVKVHNDGIV